MGKRNVDGGIKGVLGREGYCRAGAGGVMSRWIGTKLDGLLHMNARQRRDCKVNKGRQAV